MPRAQLERRGIPSPASQATPYLEWRSESSTVTEPRASPHAAWKAHKHVVPPPSMGTDCHSRMPQMALFSMAKALLTKQMEDTMSLPTR